MSACSEQQHQLHEEQQENQQQQQEEQRKEGKEDIACSGGGVYMIGKHPSPLRSARQRCAAALFARPLHRSLPVLGDDGVVQSVLQSINHRLP